MTVGTEVARLYASLTADSRQFEAALKRSDGLISGVGNTLGTFVKVGIGAAVAGFAAMAAGIGSALSASSQFDKTMSGAKAILNATGEEMSQLNSLALQLGKDTVFSASDAGKAIEMLGQDGLSVQEIMGGAAKATVDLAAATGSDLTTAANIGSKAMKAFGIPASEMEKAINGISGAANTNGLTINGYALALAAAGGIAAETGVSFNDFNATIATIMPSFGSAQDAGTSFKTFLQRLVPQSNEATDAMRALGLFTGLSGKEYDDAKAKIAKYEKELAGLDPTSKNYEKRAHDIKGQIDVLNASLKTGQNAFFNTDGSMKNMTEVAGILQKALNGLSDEAKSSALTNIFGADASRAAAALAKAGISGFSGILDKINKADAAKMAATRLDNLAGDVEQLSGSFDTLKIVMGQAFSPLARKVVQFLTSKLNNLLGMDFKPFAARFERAWDKVQGVITRVIGLFDRFASKSAGGLPSILSTLGEVFGEWAADIWTWIEPGLSAAITNLANWIRNPSTSTIGTALSTGWDWFTRWAGAVWDYVGPKLGELFSALSSWVTDPSKRSQLWNGIVSTWNVFTSWAGAIWDAVSPYLLTFWNYLSSWVTDPAKRTILWNGIVATWDFFAKWAGIIWDAVSPYLAEFWNYLASWVTDPAKRTTLYNAIVAGWTAFSDWAQYIAGAVSPYLSEFWSWLSSWVMDEQKRTMLWNGIKSTWSFIWDWAAYIVGAVSPYLVTFWNYLSSWVTDPAKRTILWNGIKSTWTGFTDWAAAIWGGSDGKSGVSKYLTDLWTSMNGWLLTNVPQLKPWEDAFGRFISGAHDQWIKDFPEMKSNFVQFETDITAATQDLGKSFADLWETIFGKFDTPAEVNGGNFIAGLTQFFSEIEGTLVNSLKFIKLLVDALDYGLKAWKAGLSFNYNDYMSNAAKFMETMSAIGNLNQPAAPNNSYDPNNPNAVIDQSSPVPGRAGGGPVVSGQPYMTGEHGRELFVPQSSGQIYNAADTSALMNTRTSRIELAVTGDSNLPMDRQKLRELAIMLGRELNLSGALLTMN